jgi:drug/metabolite transporter (DMT)-like permease
MMRLDCDWQDILRRAWSVRLFALSVLCDVLGIVLAVNGVFSPERGAALWLQIAGALFGAAGFAARFVYQRGLSKEMHA